MRIVGTKYWPILNKKLVLKPLSTFWPGANKILNYLIS